MKEPLPSTVNKSNIYTANYTVQNDYKGILGKIVAPNKFMKISIGKINLPHRYTKKYIIHSYIL